MVGSTRLKQSGHFPIQAPSESDAQLHQLEPEWSWSIFDFYREYQKEFIGQWSHYVRTEGLNSGWSPQSAPELWKLSGDELLFICELHEPEDAYACVVTWLRAAKRYRNRLAESAEGLDIKAAAWVAGFPIVNHELVFRTSAGTPPEVIDLGRDPLFNNLLLLNEWYSHPGSRQGFTMDFIGPSIDTGFRISPRATPRRFVISLELAWLLACVSQEGRQEIAIRYGGRFELKGIIGEQPYPIFWIDAADGERLAAAEDKISLQTPALKNGPIIEFCEAFFEANTRFMFRPFILGSNDPRVAARPPNYDARLRKLCETFENEKNKLEVEQASVRGETPAEPKGEDISNSEIDDFSKQIGEQSS